MAYTANKNADGSRWCRLTVLWTLWLIPMRGQGAFSDEMVAVGTSPYEEYESRVAVSSDDPEKVNFLLRKMSQWLGQVIQDSRLQFPALFGKRYRIEQEPHPYIFEDIYFDTAKWDLFQREISYRLRYRWYTFSDFFLYPFFPFIRNFFPIRCEVQMKTDYRFDLKNQALKVKETRFEFRNESFPFSEKRDAPPTPWPKEQYIGFAKKGQYKAYIMATMHELRSALKGSGHNVTIPELFPVIRVVTTRNRTHLNAPNPWGRPPNPKQVFIISFDRARFFPVRDGKPAAGLGDVAARHELVELEIEIDRSVLANIYELIGGKKIYHPKIETVRPDIARFTSRALEALRNDAAVITEQFRILADKHGLKAGNVPHSKYVRGVMGSGLHQIVH